MTNKIFITGFQRGGTTLLRRLINLHPQVEIIMHEAKILKRANDIKSLYDIVRTHKKWRNHDINGVWGDKLPWNTYSGDDILSCINKWHKIFGDNSRIINIIRHPIDVGLSNNRRGWLYTGEAVERWRNSMPIVVKAVDKFNGLNIVYEELLLNPKAALENMFKYCDLDYSEEIVSEIANADRKDLRYFDKIDSSRAFAHVFDSSYRPDYSIEEYLDFVKPYTLGDFNEYFNVKRTSSNR